MKFAGIEFHGCSDTTRSCLNAIAGLHNSPEQIETVKLLTASNRHAFLVFYEHGRIVAIKSGFSSGYAGEGPKGLATALRYFQRMQASLTEHLIDRSVMDRLNDSAMTIADHKKIENAPIVPGARWMDYMDQFHLEPAEEAAEFQRLFPFSLPLRVVDPRIQDLALELFDNPDATLLTGYRRLEQTIKVRCKMQHVFGANLVRKAFGNSDSVLTWPACENGECEGRAKLFEGVFGAFRNSRAHNERHQTTDEYIREFLLLNELYRLEFSAEPRLKNVQSEAD